MFPPFIAMHIPDGFLSIPVSLIGWAILIVLIAISLRQTRQQFSERQIPLMGIVAACIFAGQMLNFPVAGGTSGHLGGAAFAAVLLGPYASALIMTVVLGVQAFIFQDGGLLALGFNAVNLGIIAGFISYALYRLIWKGLGSTPTAQLIGAAVGAWLSIVAASAVCALELAISGTATLNIALPAMVGIHALIGVGEALITVAALAFIRQVRPDLNHNWGNTAAKGSSWIAVGLLIAIALAFASPLASSSPDGLERVAEDAGFIEMAEDAPYQVLPDYTVPFIQDQVLTTIAAGVIGVLLIAGASIVIARVTPKNPPDEPLNPHP